MDRLDYMKLYEIRPVAHMRSAFRQKYGIPRQPRMVDGLRSEIVFDHEFNIPEAVRGLDKFSHIWLIWGFSENRLNMRELHPAWRPTVRPPRLGGSVRMGVFATRSPYRPNSLGMSAVKLVEVRYEDGQVSLIVEGADLLDGTPIYDIKPYLPYSDAITEATEGFVARPEASGKTEEFGETGKCGKTEEHGEPERTGEKDDIPGAQMTCVEVEFPDHLLAKVEEQYRKPIIGILQLDPRDAYDRDSDKPSRLAFGNVDIEFISREGKLIVTAVRELAE